jgi:hypothetical protein
MRDIQSSVKASLRNGGNTAWYNFGSFNVFENEDSTELFVEFYSKNSDCNAVVNVTRLGALGVMDAIGNEDYNAVHLTVAFLDNVARVSITSDMFELNEEELKARIAQSLRIS